MTNPTSQTPHGIAEIIRLLEKVEANISGGLCYFTAASKHYQLKDAQANLGKVFEAIRALPSLAELERDAGRMRAMPDPIAVIQRYRASGDWDNDLLTALEHEFNGTAEKPE